jgi:hypothetical protein
MITALSFTGYSKEQERTKQQGLTLVNIALSDPDFEAAWLKESCTESNGLTQRGILEVMRTTLGIDFRAYRRWWSKVIGYFVSGSVVWDNLKYLDHFDAVESGSNDLHEAAHMKGFPHNHTWGTSVPYTLNRVFEKWARAYLAKNKLPAPSETPPAFNAALAQATAAALANQGMIV